MKCLKNFGLFICVLLLFFGVGGQVLAQIEGTTTPDSTIVGGTGGVYADFGVEGYPQSKYVYGDPFEDTELIAYNGHPITILAFSIFSFGAFSFGGKTLYCHTDSGDIDLTFGQYLSGHAVPVGMSFKGAYVCDGSLRTVGDDLENQPVAVQYLDYDINNSWATTSDVVMALAIITTLIFVAFIAFIFNKIKSRKPWLRS